MEVFTKETGIKFKKALVVAVAMMALGNAQEASAQGKLVKLIDKVSQTVGDFNQKTGHLLSSIENAQHQVDIAKYHNECLDKRTGNIVSGAANVVTGLIAKNKIKKEMKRQQEAANQTSGYAQGEVQANGQQVYQATVEQLAAAQARIAELEAEKAMRGSQGATQRVTTTATRTVKTPQKATQSKDQKAAELFAKMKSEGYVK